jgi:hypothetical protein
VHQHQQGHEKQHGAQNANRVNRRQLLAKVTPDQPYAHRAQPQRDHERAPAEQLVDEAQPDARQSAGLLREEADQCHQRDNDQRDPQNIKPGIQRQQTLISSLGLARAGSLCPAGGRFG